jgi:hypothetical protein
MPPTLRSPRHPRPQFRHRKNTQPRPPSRLPPNLAAPRCGGADLGAAAGGQPVLRLLAAIGALPRGVSTDHRGTVTGTDMIATPDTGARIGATTGTGASPGVNGTIAGRVARPKGTLQGEWKRDRRSGPATRSFTIALQCVPIQMTQSRGHPRARPGPDGGSIFSRAKMGRRVKHGNSPESGST